MSPEYPPEPQYAPELPEIPAAPPPVQIFDMESTLALDSLNDGVRQVLRAALARDMDIQIDMDAIYRTPNGVWRQIEILSGAMNGLTRAQGKLYPILGRIFIWIQNNPIVFKEMGYESFREFIDKGIQESLGMSRATAYRAMQMVNNFPSLTPADVGRIGTANVYVMSKVFGNEENPAAKELIENSRSMPEEEFRAQFREVFRVDDGTAEKSDPVLIIRTTPEIAGMWKRFIEDPDIQAYCETEIPGYILKRMIDECEGEWVRQIVEQRKNPTGASDIPPIDMEAFMRD